MHRSIVQLLLGARQVGVEELPNGSGTIGEFEEGGAGGSAKLVVEARNLR